MKTTIKFAGYQGEHSVHTRAANVFCETLQRTAGNFIEVDYEQNIVSKGFKAADLLSRTENGDIDGCYFSSSYLADRVPELGLFDQHFVVPDRKHAYAVLDGKLGNRLADEVAKRTGLKVLGYWDNGIRHISSVRGPIQHPRDCEGLNIRTLKNEDHQRVFRALGFNPMAIDVRDLPDAVANQTVDAQENPLTNIVNFGLHNTHKHITLTRHLLGVAALFFNQNTVNSWTDDMREAVVSALAVATREQRRYAVEEDTRCIDVLKQAGCEISELTDSQRAEFASATAESVAATCSTFDKELVDLFEADLASVSD